MAQSYDEILQNLVAYVVANDPSITAFDVGGQVRTLLETVAQQLADLSMTNATTITSEAEAGIYDGFKFPRLPAQPAVGVAVFTGVPGASFPQGGIVSTVPSPITMSQVYQTLATYTIPSGASVVSGMVQALTAGSAGNIQPGQLTTLVTVTSGIISVTNPAAFTGGQDAESQIARGQRFTTYVNSLSRGTVAALTQAASQVGGVAAVNVIETPYITAVTLTNGVAADHSSAANTPYTPGFAALAAPVNAGDAFVLGAPVLWSSAYIECATVGSGLVGGWEYYSATAGGWAELTPIVDNTNGLLNSGTLSWTPPSDWAQTLVNQTAAWYIRWAATSGGGTAPTLYFVEGLNPPAGFVNVVVAGQGQTMPSAALLDAVSAACDAQRAAGVTVNTIAVTYQQVNVTMGLVLSPLVDALATQSAAVTAVETYLNSLAIGQAAYVQQIEQAVLGVSGGGAVLSVTIQTPAADVYVLPTTQLVSGNIQITSVVT